MRLPMDKARATTAVVLHFCNPNIISIKLAKTVVSIDLFRIVEAFEVYRHPKADYFTGHTDKFDRSYDC